LHLRLERRTGDTIIGLLAYIQRTTVKLLDQFDGRLRHEAERRGIPVSAVTREEIGDPAAGNFLVELVAEGD
jgi:hypothetical protein